MQLLRGQRAWNMAGATPTASLVAVPARVRALTVHGTDVTHPRTRLATAAALSWIDLPAAVSEPLLEQLPWRAARGRARVLPCGVDLDRFQHAIGRETEERLPGLAGHACDRISRRAPGAV